MLNHLQAKVSELGKTTSKINLGSVFSDTSRSYLNEFTLFGCLFQLHPKLHS